MRCTNCGAAIRRPSDNAYFQCEYCNALVAKYDLSVAAHPALPPERLEPLTKLLGLAQMDVESQDYDAALDKSDRALELEPSAWEALLIKAVAAFWLGRDDFRHMRDVTRLLDRARELSREHPRVHDARKAIAFNVVSISVAKDRTGDHITNALESFAISRGLCTDLPPRDDMVREYSRACANELCSRLTRLMKNQKKQYEPAMNEIDTLRRLVDLLDDLDLCKFYRQHAHRYLERNRTRAHAPLLERQINDVHARIVAKEPAYLFKPLKLGLFS